MGNRDNQVGQDQRFVVIVIRLSLLSNVLDIFYCCILLHVFHKISMIVQRY